MKISFWDILAILGVLALLAVAAGLAVVFLNPQSALNPFPPATLPARVVIPSETPTMQQLPPTWTVVVTESTQVVLGETPLPPVATNDNLPTLTPRPTATSTPTPTKEMTATYTQAPNQALWISQSPEDGKTFSPGEDFDMVWRIKNTGTLAWTKRYSFEYVSGAPIHKYYSEIALKDIVQPGGTAVLTVDMVAPMEPGSYRTEWAMVDDTNNRFYHFFFFFTVK
ncbi:MAG TPA: NBR1-Ig-like domain-containing protein [Anaerolineaceae bacterium]|nr:NBR1-Ig-like domain-containing protein [Anaerolineaceae bacterium]HQN04271.1 NBR1-Ig-like domain-containing protein [Anaerolineaceae bacterium]HQP07725.1 NBR1-Ig-like domain-containing protein [Anaerolineaceae bacterium]